MHVNHGDERMTFLQVSANQGRCTSGRKACGFRGALPISGVAVGDTDAFGVPTAVAVDVALEVGSAPVAVGVAVAVGDAAPVVGVAVREGVGDGDMPLKGVSVT